VSARPLVSIITGTIPSRLDLVIETMNNVRAQTYPNLEHCIAIEGEPDEVEAAVTRVRFESVPMSRFVSTRTVSLGRWWSVDLSESYAAAPFMVGQMMARGAYACLWADDERALDPEHLTKMVDLIESSGADFVYPIVDFWWKDDPERHRLIWADPPQHGSITHWLYRPSMIEKAGGPYRTHVGRANDWEFIERAMQGGATWAFLPEITFSHRADA
jgi:GT2 family glycosyltransferase